MFLNMLCYIWNRDVRDPKSKEMEQRETVQRTQNLALSEGLPKVLSQVKGPTQSFQSVWPLFINASKMDLLLGSIKKKKELKKRASCSGLHQPLPGFWGTVGAKHLFFYFMHF